MKRIVVPLAVMLAMLTNMTSAVFAQPQEPSLTHAEKEAIVAEYPGLTYEGDETVELTGDLYT